MDREMRLPAFEPIPENIDPNLRSILEQIILAIDIREGRVASKTNAAFVTRQEIIDAGVPLPP